MDESDIHFKLLCGLPIYIQEAGYLKIPTLKEIAAMDFSLYNLYLSHILIDKKMLSNQYDESVTNFDIFYANMLYNEEFKETAVSAIQLFFSELPVLMETENTIYISIGQGKITYDNFGVIQKVLMLGNNTELVKEPEYNPGNSRAKKMIQMIMKNREKQPKPKEKIDLQSIISGLAWKDNGVSLKEITNMTIYQIYNGFYVTNNIDNYRHTMSGLYAGTIDSKSVKMADIHWANKYK